MRSGRGSRRRRAVSALCTYDSLAWAGIVLLAVASYRLGRDESRMPRRLDTQRGLQEQYSSTRHSDGSTVTHRAARRQQRQGAGQEAKSSATSQTLASEMSQSEELQRRELVQELAGSLGLDITLDTFYAPWLLHDFRHWRETGITLVRRR